MTSLTKSMLIAAAFMGAHIASMANIAVGDIQVGSVISDEIALAGPSNDFVVIPSGKWLVAKKMVFADNGEGNPAKFGSVQLLLKNQKPNAKTPLVFMQFWTKSSQPRTLNQDSCSLTGPSTAFQMEFKEIDSVGTCWLNGFAFTKAAIPAVTATFTLKTSDAMRLIFEEMGSDPTLIKGGKTKYNLLTFESTKQDERVRFFYKIVSQINKDDSIEYLRKSVGQLVQVQNGKHVTLDVPAE
jgi:hypothetical protein